MVRTLTPSRLLGVSVVPGVKPTIGSMRVGRTLVGIFLRAEHVHFCKGESRSIWTLSSPSFISNKIIIKPHRYSRVNSRPIDHRRKTSLWTVLDTLLGTPSLFRDAKPRPLTEEEGANASLTSLVIEEGPK